jgi:hypothetical protein
MQEELGKNLKSFNSMGTVTPFVKFRESLMVIPAVALQTRA